MPADTDLLPPEARRALDEYLTALDAALPGAASGIYVTGSAALGDWRPGRSDLDLLVLTEGPLSTAGLAALQALHAGIPDRPYRDAIYLPAAAAGTGRTGDRRYPSSIDGVFQDVRYSPEPVLWATLHRHGLTVRGPAASSLGTDPGQDWLREWNHANLEAYWRPWAANARSMLASREPGDPLLPGTVPWGALGPGRLHATISTGAIISKSAAAEYTAALFPDYGDLLTRCGQYRRGDDSLVFTVSDGYAACDLIDAVADHAASLPGGQDRPGAPGRPEIGSR